MKHRFIVHTHPTGEGSPGMIGCMFSTAYAQMDQMALGLKLRIAKHCQQLETIRFNGFNITKEMASHIMMQLAIKRLIFKQCWILEEVAQVFVQALKDCDHSFCDIKLFETKLRRWNYCWTSDHDNWSDYEKAWKKCISVEIEDLLTWSNQFREDRDSFLTERLGDASMDHKLDWIVWNSGDYWLSSLHCSDSQKLYYCAITEAQSYDNISNCSPPSMLYSLIKKIRDYFRQFNTCTSTRKYLYYFSMALFIFDINSNSPSQKDKTMRHLYGQL